MRSYSKLCYADKPSPKLLKSICHEHVLIVTYGIVKIATIEETGGTCKNTLAKATIRKDSIFKMFSFGNRELYIYNGVEGKIRKH